MQGSKRDSPDLERAFAEAWAAVLSSSNWSYVESSRTTHLSATIRAPFGPAVPPRLRLPEPAHIRNARPVQVVIRQSDRGPPRLSFIKTFSAQPLFEEYRSLVTSCTPVIPSAKHSYDEKIFACQVTSTDKIDELTDAYPLPDISQGGSWAKLRCLYGSYYRRLWASVLFVNIVAMAVMISRTIKTPGSITYGNVATATSVNLFVSTLARHEHFVNVLFRVACSLPHRTPLWIRRRVAKVYSYGGVHSACGISASLWYVVYAVLATLQFQGTVGEKRALEVTMGTTIILFIIITLMAHPNIRRCWHNEWEISHRYGAWAAIVLVWVQTLIIIVAQANHASESVGLALVTSPTFYFLTLITTMLVYPWLRLRRRRVDLTEQLSTHAIRLHFNDGTLPTCVGYRFSHKPLLENHSFATIPNVHDEEAGYSILISNAGDWTRNLITNPPTHIWTRGAPTTGVMRIASLFRPLLVVATGSGIGPCMSFLQPRPDWPVHVIWSCRSPESTYGAEIIRTVLRADRKAMIIDTKKTGHPKLPALAWAKAQETGAEAVVVISNPKVTREVVFALESRGLAAFGAIFDS